MAELHRNAAATTITNPFGTPDTGQLTSAITVSAGCGTADDDTAADVRRPGVRRTDRGRPDRDAQTLTVNGQTSTIVQVALAAPPRQNLRPLTSPPAPARCRLPTASRVEGNAGTSWRRLTVSLALAGADDITVTYTTSNGSATAPADYQSITSGAVIPAGATSEQATVTINGDGTFEGDETFIVTLRTRSARPSAMRPRPAPSSTTTCCRWR